MGDTRDDIPLAATEDREIDWVDVTGWGAFKGHAIPVEVGQHIADKVNAYHKHRISALEAQLAERARVAELLRVIEHEATKQPSGPVGALETDELLWCETCGERPQELRTEHAGLCRECWVSEGRPE